MHQNMQLKLFWEKSSNAGSRILGEIKIFSLICVGDREHPSGTYTYELWRTWIKISECISFGILQTRPHPKQVFSALQKCHCTHILVQKYLYL